MEQFCSQLKLGFGIVTSTQTVTSKGSPGNSCQADEMNTGILKYSEKRSQDIDIPLNSFEPGIK
jgi:hypothetical protein